MGRFIEGGAYKKIQEFYHPYLKFSLNCNGQIGKLETFWKVRDEISGKFSYMQSKESYFATRNREKVTVTAISENI